MKSILKIKSTVILSVAVSIILTACTSSSHQTASPNATKDSQTTALPTTINVEGIALNPEGIEYDKNDHTFLLSSLNAAPIIKVNPDGTFKPFTHGEKFPLSTAGLQVDYQRNRLLVAGFNGTEIMDNDPETKGAAFLRVYNLNTGALEQDINLDALVPEAHAYFANDVAVDSDGNAYVSDWYAGVIYKVDVNGKATLFWKKDSGVQGGPNGLDYHTDGYLLVSIIAVNDKGLYTEHGLVKIPLNNPTSATNVKISDADFSGFDGMVINTYGHVVGVTNNGTDPGGNTLIELSSKDGWKSAEVVNTKAITTSTTVAITPDNKQFIINQDFSNNFAKTWTIEQVKF